MSLFRTGVTNTCTNIILLCYITINFRKRNIDKLMQSRLWQNLVRQMTPLSTTTPLIKF